MWIFVILKSIRMSNIAEIIKQINAYILFRYIYFSIILLIIIMHLRERWCFTYVEIDLNDDNVRLWVRVKYPAVKAIFTSGKAEQHIEQTEWNIIVRSSTARQAIL